jgi:ABC-2 type transport system ATP-binding protein
MRVADYLRYCGRLHGLRGRAQADAQARALARCDLTAVAGRIIGNLSKGYQQRVGIAQAILHQPAVLILDEPTVGLDPLQIRQVRALLGELREQHAIIISSHILPEIQALCDRVLILHQGRPVYQGTLEAPAGAALQVLLHCHQPPDPAQLAALPGVLSLQALDDRRLQLRLRDSLAAERVQQAVLGAGWGLAEWLPLQHRLEQLFVSLTHGDSAQAAP